MKKIIPLIILFFCSCKETETEPKPLENENQLTGKELFATNNCNSCHQINQKTIGPSLIEIATIYKKNNASIIDFLKGNSLPIVNTEQYEIMKNSLELTKTMSEDELASLEKYINNPGE